MKAIVQNKYGTPDDLELREVDRPSVGEDEVLVRVRSASLHPDVWHAVYGRPYALRLIGIGLFKPKYPIPGTDMAGIVDSVGRGVKRFRPGDAVFGETGPGWAKGGAYAEYVSVPQDCLALKPENVTFEQAASVPASGFIALQNLRGASHDWRGHSVLVNGAGGGVGSIALQVAKACGAHVTGVDSAGKLEMLRSLGADEVIDYARQDFTQGSARYDLIFDIPGNRPLSVCRCALKPEGKYVPIGHSHFDASSKRFLGLFPHFFQLILVAFFVKQLRRPGTSTPDRKEVMAILRELLEAGKLTPVIDSTYPLSEVREAFRHMVEDEPLGKVMLTVG